MSSSTPSLVDEDIPDYSNEQVFERNRMPTRAYHIPETSMLLNGTWDFHYALTPLEAPEPSDIARKSTAPLLTPSDTSVDNNFDEVLDVPEWRSIPVPSHWQLHGHGRPHYTNTVYPFPVNPPYPPSENPTGTYRRLFQIPLNWASDSQLRLRFDGVDSAYHIWVNGEFVGYSQGSRNAAEFDISGVVRRHEQNVVQVRVYQWSDGSYIEDQDQWWLSGIFRDVHLLAFPRSHIEDFFIQTHLDAKYKDAKLKINLSVILQDKSRITVALTRDQDEGCITAKSFVCEKDTNEQVFELSVKNPEKWTAETPHLYHLDMAVTEIGRQNTHHITQQVGFRKVELKKGLITVNGVPILFRGVNRHDHHPLHGRAVPLDYMRRDLILMKQHNINALRTSHYPPHPKLLEMTNELGFWVIDEADLECHGFLDAVEKPMNIPESVNYEERKKMTFPLAARYTSDNPKWREAYLDRIRQLVQRDKNQPSVIIWSLGNEAFYGRNHKAMYDYAKTADRGRLVHYEADREAESADMYSYMYPAVDQLIEISKTQGVKDDGTYDKPVILCEYNHAMGNHGNAEKYQEAFRQHPRLQGGFIWEWANHGLWKEEGDKSFYTYGGDFGEQPNDGTFIADGLNFSNHTPAPGFGEFKRIIAPVRAWLDEDSREVVIENGFDFANLNGITADYEVQTLGAKSKQTIASGSISLQGLDKRRINRNILSTDLFKVNTAAEIWLTLTFRLAHNTPWAPAGHVMTWSQIRLKPFMDTTNPFSSAPFTPKPLLLLLPLTLHISRTSYTIHSSTSTLTFSRITGTLTTWTSLKRTLLSTPTPAPPTLQVPNPNTLSRSMRHTGAITPGYWRAPTDNDIPGFAPKWRQYGLDALTSSLSSFCVSYSNEEEIVLTAVTTVAPPVLDWRCVTTTTYRITAAGQVFIATQIKPEGYTPPTLPRVGLDLCASRKLEKVKWCGVGPGQSYPDAKLAGMVGLWESEVEKLWVNYEHPQENGNRMDTRWLEITDDRGWGIRVTLIDRSEQGDAQTNEVEEKPEGRNWFNWQASRYTVEAVEKARHPCDLVKEDAVLLRLDIATAGLGTAACGPRTLEEFQVKCRERRWEFCLEALNG